MEIKEISVETLQEWRNTGKEHQLIDVRETYEIEILLLIPLIIAKIGPNQYGYWLASGGILAWADKIDTSIEKY